MKRAAVLVVLAAAGGRQEAAVAPGQEAAAGLPEPVRTVHWTSPWPAAVEQLPNPAAIELLRLLVRRPRAAAEPWLRRLVQDEKFPAVGRLLALRAIHPSRWTILDARFVLGQCVVGEPETRAEAQAATGLVRPDLADRLAGDLHRLVVEGHPIDTLLLAFDQATAAGRRHLLSLALSLPEPEAELLCDAVAGRDPAAVTAHAALMLDDGLALPAFLLRRLGPALDRDVRVQRVRALLDGPDEPRRFAAFLALADSGHVDAGMLQIALADTPPNRYRQALVLAVDAGRWPEEVLLRCLREGDERLRVAVCHSLARHEWTPRIEQELLRRTGASGATALDRDALLFAIAARGRLTGLESAWKLASDQGRITVLRELRYRGGTFALGFLRAQRSALPPGELREQVTVTLASLGGADDAALLLAAIRAGGVSTARLAQAAFPERLAPEHVVPLLELIGAEGVDPGLRALLLPWLMKFDDPRVQATAQRIHEQAADEDSREEALLLLLAGDGAAPFVRRIEAALRDGKGAGAEDVERMHWLAGCSKAPLSRARVELLARIALWLPLRARPGVEAPSALRRAVVEVLRRDAQADLQAFATVAAELPPESGAEREATWSGWLELLAADPRLRLCVAPHFARRLLHAAVAPRARWPAELIVAEEHEAAGRFAAAAAAYARAWRGLLLAPLPPKLQRVYVGDDVPFRACPSARLATRILRCQAEDCRRRGDHAAARAHAALAMELAFGDHAAEAIAGKLLELCK